VVVIPAIVARNSKRQRVGIVAAPVAAMIEICGRQIISPVPASR